MTDLLDHLKAALKDRYDVERKLGQGGMATVFLARDVKHGRMVAIKVLHDDIGMALGPERFRREIQIATSLSHPHILQLFDSGEADGKLFYVMPFVEGESLRDRMNREKILPIEDALRITQEVASALDFAHRKQIVHRDIKPENILLQEGQALVADFGLARAVDAVNTGQTLTQTGVSLGTPLYMSPEQAFAEKEIDGRSDEYSLACVLYEMLTGQPPFTGPNAQAIMARHSMSAVPSMQIVRNTIPDEVEDLVQRALAKSPADRFSTLAEFANELKECVIDHATVTRRIDRRTVARPIQKAASKKKKYTIAASVALPVIIGGFVAWKLIGHSANATAATGGMEPNKVAVMYFDDVSGGGKLAYMADGLTESLINELSQVQALDVVSKSGVGLFKGSDASPDSIAKTLNAGTLVRGSVDETGDKLRVSVRLIDGNSGADLHREAFDLPKANALAVRDSLVREVANFLRSRVGDEVKLRSARAGTTNVAAWTLLQRAEKLRKDGEAQARTADSLVAKRNFAFADSLLVQAEGLDPNWVDPITMLSKVSLTRVKATNDPLVAKPWIEKGIADANRALAKDRKNSDALEMLGTLRYSQWAMSLAPNPRDAPKILDSAEANLTAAVAKDPANANAWNTLSAVYSQKDNTVQAKVAATRAYEADAYLTGTDKLLWRLYATSYDLEQFPDAVKYCDEGARRFPQNPQFVRCRLWLQTTRAVVPDPPGSWKLSDRLKELHASELQQHEGEMLVAASLARAGQLDSAGKVLRRAEPDVKVDPNGTLVGYEAFIRTLFGTKQDTTEAFNLLSRFLSANPAHRAGYAESQSWWWKGLKRDPRFEELVAGAR